MQQAGKVTFLTSLCKSRLKVHFCAVQRAICRAVSYTHLDVYKRQQKECSFASSQYTGLRIVKNSGHFKKVNTNTRDVYERARVFVKYIKKEGEGERE